MSDQIATRDQSSQGVAYDGSTTSQILTMEVTTYGDEAKGDAPNGCEWDRGGMTEAQAQTMAADGRLNYDLNDEKPLYNVGWTSADTYYCHHLNKVT